MTPREKRDCPSNECEANQVSVRKLEWLQFHECRDVFVSVPSKQLIPSLEGKRDSNKTWRPSVLNGCDTDDLDIGSLQIKRS